MRIKQSMDIIHPVIPPPTKDVWCDWCTETHVRQEHVTGPKDENKLTESVVKKLTEAFLIDATIKQACFLSGISHQSYFNWKARHPKLFEQLEEFKEDTKVKAKATLKRGITKDPKLALDYLSRVERDSYSTRQELTGKDGGPMEIKPVEVMGVADDVNKVNDKPKEATR